MLTLMMRKVVRNYWKKKMTRTRFPMNTIFSEVMTVRQQRYRTGTRMHSGAVAEVNIRWGHSNQDASETITRFSKRGRRR